MKNYALFDFSDFPLPPSTVMLFFVRRFELFKDLRLKISIIIIIIVIIIIIIRLLWLLLLLLLLVVLVVVVVVF